MRRFAALIRFLRDSGARLGEALQTGPSDLSSVHWVDEEGGERDAWLVTFPRYRTTSDKPRSVPLTAAAKGVIDALDVGLVKGKAAYFPINPGTAWYMWDNVREDMKKPGFDLVDATLHTLRHTCLTRLAQGGMGLLQLQQWAGHSDPKITAERYVHLRPSDPLGGLGISPTLEWR